MDNRTQIGKVAQSQRKQSVFLFSFEGPGSSESDNSLTKKSASSQLKVSIMASALILGLLVLFLLQKNSSASSPLKLPEKLDDKGFGHLQFIDPDDSPEIIAWKAARIVPTQRQLDWQSKELSAFIHFGLNTFTDKEHGEGTEDPSLFNPTHFNPRQWTRVLKEAGFKMVVLTARHHDGFCLWPTKTTDYSVKKKSRWKEGRGDVVRDVAMACREEGLDFGLYLSPWGRHEKSYGTPQYNTYFLTQLKELLSNYGPIAEVWFDGYCGEGPDGRKMVYDWNSYYELIRKMQPQAVIAIMGPDVRWVGNERGLARESEWSVLPLDLPEDSLRLLRSGQYTLERVFKPEDLMASDLGSREKITRARALFWYPAEVDVSIRPGWFYHPNQDNQVKSPFELFEIYLKSVGRNSVLLLNVPPDRRGLIAENDVRSLLGFKKLLDQTFKKGRLQIAGVTSNHHHPDYPARLLLDRNRDSGWRAAPGRTRATIEFLLKTGVTFDCVELQEDIRQGQRIEEFALEAYRDQDWVEIAAGTTVGYKRIITFEPFTSEKIRLVIKQARDAPTLKSFKLFKIPNSITGKSIS